MLLLLASLAHAEDVYVSSNVKGAAIFLNGVETGLRTPATLTGVAPGAVEISVEAGCARGSATVMVESGVANRVGLVAMAEDSVIVVNPEPIQARLFLDDEAYPGRAGASVAVECGAHVIRAELDGYVASSITVELGAGEERQIPIELAVMGLATVDLSVQPRNATLTLDGKAVGTDAVTLPSVYAGGHVFGAILGGYKEAAIEVVISDGEQQAWHFNLSGENGKKESTATQLRGPKPGLVVDASGPNAAKTSGGTATATVSASTSTATSSATSTPTSTPTSTATSTPTSTPAPTSSSSTAAKSSSGKSSGGSDYYSRLRTDTEGGDDGTADVDEASPTSSSKSSSSGSSGSKSGGSTAKEADDDDLPTRYEDLDEPAATTTSTKTKEKEENEEKEEKAEKAAKSSDRDDEGDDGKKSKVGLDVTGTTMMVLGAGGAASAVYFWDRTTVAYDAYNAKVDAADASGDQRLQKAADDYYDTVLVPKRNLMYASAGAAGVLGLTGFILVLVDQDLPMIAPLPQGGAMVSWGGRF